MIVRETGLKEVLCVQPEVHGDERGWFYESYRADSYRENGIEAEFVQDNFSRSQKGVLRGIHYQWPHAQAKLVSVLAGAVLDVAVDLRQGSPTFGCWIAERLDDRERRQLYLPAGFGHGFLTLADDTIFHYKCSEVYHPECEYVVCWNDPALGIDWHVVDPLVSDKDRGAPRLEEIPSARLPVFELPVFE